MLKEARGLSEGRVIVLEAEGLAVFRETRHLVDFCACKSLLLLDVVPFHPFSYIARRDVIVGIILKDHMAFL